VKTSAAKARVEHTLGKQRARVRKPKRPKTYHHGSLREALLQAAERILERDGIQGLTLRAAAREAGVTHAAPKTHFGDMTGLLSELAAVGFAQFVATMQANVRASDPPDQRMAAIGRGYVTFARSHPGLFLLMFRSERLDMRRPALRDAVAASSRVLSGAVGAVREESVATATLTLSQAASIVRAWSLVHGFAMLLLDGRLGPIISRLPAGTDAEELLTAILEPARVKR
jgi:AcrR family transcriptional regulator